MMIEVGKGMMMAMIQVMIEMMVARIKVGEGDQDVNIIIIKKVHDDIQGII